MLKYLQVQNFALAEDLRIEFQPGLNILTGETGTGKSILVGAIAAVLGGRVFTEVVRTGFESANIVAIFETSKLKSIKDHLKKSGINSGDELILKREISVKGSTRAYINDSPVTVGTLATTGDFLVDVHGQHEHQSLLKQEVHRYFLDAFGQLHPLLSELKNSFEKLKKIQTELESLQSRQEELSEKLELYRFQLNEIDKAQLTPAEDVKLEEERKILANSEKIFELCNQLDQIFNDSNANLNSLIGEANHRLRDLGQYSEELNKLHREFESAKIIVAETTRTVEEFRNNLEFDPARLEEIEGRLNHLNILKKKYGSSIEEVLEYREKLHQEVSSHDNFEFEIGNLRRQYQTALDEYKNLALRLSERRHEVAKKLEIEVQEQLNRLGMPGTKFEARLQFQPDDNGIVLIDGGRFFGDKNGIDIIEFYISPNPGEDFKPLNKIASGGEISRIMLALKSILAEIDQIPTLIFDEIDLGVSGRIAQAVGRSMANLSKLHQILCITHLPQIASQGTTHFTVEKHTKDKRTYTKVIGLNEDERVDEIARLIGGKHISESVRQSARQLIEEGKVLET